MSHQDSTAQTVGGVGQAIDNLQAIKSGEDPRQSQRDASVVVDELARKRAAKQDREAECYGRTRDEIHDAFVRLLNVIEPEHPYRPQENTYPAKTSDVRFSYHKESSGTWASCGPRNDAHVPFSFSVDRSMFESARPSFLFVVLAHEVAHIEHGSHSDSSGHRPVFWERMAEMVAAVLEHRDHLVAGSLPAEFEQRVVEQTVWDVNCNNIDRRSVDVHEQRSLVLDHLTRACRRRELDMVVEAEYRND